LCHRGRGHCGVTQCSTHVSLLPGRTSREICRGGELRRGGAYIRRWTQRPAIVRTRKRPQPTVRRWSRSPRRGRYTRNVSAFALLDRIPYEHPIVFGQGNAERVRTIMESG
jgi:hypothetical protein